MPTEVRDVNGTLLEVGAVVRYRYRDRPRGPGRLWGWTEDPRSDLRLTSVKASGWCRGRYVDPEQAPDGIAPDCEWSLAPWEIADGRYVVVTPPGEELERRDAG